MTPKEKAEELVEKFLQYTAVEYEYRYAKQCALICVDEIIKTKPLEKDYQDHGHRGREVWYNDMTSYWQQVKQEIENL